LEKARGEALLADLAKDSPGFDFAALEFRNQVFFTRFPKNARAELLESAITRLVQGIYDEYPEQARQLLRQRIFSTAEPTLLDQAMVKVGARKLTALPNSQEKSPSLSGPLPQVQPHPIDARSFHEVFAQTPHPLLGYPNLPEGLTLPSQSVEAAPILWNELLTQLTRGGAKNLERHQSDRPISAVLLSPEGRLTSWTHNRSSENPTHHAELSLLLDWARTHSAPLPQGSALLCSLKPCKMCAAAIVQAASGQNLKVYYFLDDPGPLAQNTALDGNLNFYTQNMCLP
jgi:tRNA(Arg) A34 adenosine deaminase TadA